MICNMTSLLSMKKPCLRAIMVKFSTLTLTVIVKITMVTITQFFVTINYFLFLYVNFDSLCPYDI